MVGEMSSRLTSYPWQIVKPSHGSDAGAFLLAERFGSKDLTLIKDVDGLYSRDPKQHPTADFIPENVCRLVK